jgi:hypothetical protein
MRSAVAVADCKFSTPATRLRPITAALDGALNGWHRMHAYSSVPEYFGWKHTRYAPVPPSDVINPNPLDASIAAASLTAPTAAAGGSPTEGEPTSDITVWRLIASDRRCGTGDAFELSTAVEGRFVTALRFPTPSRRSFAARAVRLAFFSTRLKVADTERPRRRGWWSLSEAWSEELLSDESDSSLLCDSRSDMATRAQRDRRLAVAVAIFFARDCWRARQREALSIPP